jgi:hypothetical protein
MIRLLLLLLVMVQRLQMVHAAVAMLLHVPPIVTCVQQLTTQRFLLAVLC